jgi:hypothetical protein
MVPRKCPVSRNKDPELGVQCPPRGILLDILGIQDKPAIHIRHDLTNGIPLTHGMEGIDPLTYPVGCDDRTGERRLGVRIKHLPTVRSSGLTEVDIPALGPLRDR